MTNNWDALAKALSMTYNINLMYWLKREVAEGKEFVTITFFPNEKDYILKFSSLYSSNENDSHYAGHISFETKELLIFIEQIKGEMSQRLCLALLANRRAMVGAAKLSHNSYSKQFLNFSFTSKGICDAPWTSDIPESFTYPGLKNESCSIKQFRAWRKRLFKTKSITLYELTQNDKNNLAINNKLWLNTLFRQ